MITMTVAQLAAEANDLIENGHGSEPVYIQHVNALGITTREGVIMLTAPMNAFEKGFIWLIGNRRIEG